MARPVVLRPNTLFTPSCAPPKTLPGAHCPPTSLFELTRLYFLRAPLSPPGTPSRRTSLLTARKSEHRPSGYRARAHDARHVVQFAHDYREVARGERQRPLVHGAAHLGQKRVTYAGNPTAYHDHRRVEHVDGRG